MVTKIIPLADLSLDERITTFLLQGIETLRAITNLRNVLPLRNNPDFTLSELIVARDLEEYQQKAPRLTLDGISVQASPYSYRRFDICSDQEQYSIKAFSPLNPPIFFTDYFGNDFGLPSTIIERPLSRSLVMLQYLKERGLPYAAEARASVLFLPEERTTFYQGAVEADAYLPLEISIEATTRNTIRMDFLTPKIVGELAHLKGITPQEYMEHVLTSLGKIHYQLHHINGVCLVTALEANAKVQKYFFGVEKVQKFSSGENFFHNTELDLRTGELYLTADLSQAVLVTSSTPIEANLSENFFLRTKIRTISSEAVQEAKRTALAYFIDVAQHHRPLLYCMRDAMIITEREYRNHLLLLDKKLDESLRKEHTAGFKYLSHLMELNDEIMRLASPWCTSSPVNLMGEYTLPAIDALDSETIIDYTMMIADFFAVERSLIIESIKKQVQNSCLMSKEMVRQLKKYSSIDLQTYEAAREKEERATTALVESPVTAKIFDLFMKGYKRG